MADKIGSVAWVDLTVKDAANIKDFYEDVIGWNASPVNMGDYDDFAMMVPNSDNAAAGICYAKGSNKDMPPQWLIYIVVEDLDKSIESCLKRGGSVIVPQKNMGSTARYAVIKDPAGAISALYQNL